MDMTLQNIYFMIGIIGFVLAAICAIAAVVYFIRGDIRGVLAELSGKTRKTELAEFTEPKSSANTRRNVLTQNDEWKASVSHSDASTTGSGSSTGDESSSESGSSSGTAAAESDWSYSDVGRSSDEADKPSGDTQEPSIGINASPGFAITRRVVIVHAKNVVDEDSREVAYQFPIAENDGGER